jgi:hypothetical protein
MRIVFSLTVAVKKNLRYLNVFFYNRPCVYAAIPYREHDDGKRTKIKFVYLNFKSVFWCKIREIKKVMNKRIT